MDFGFHIDLGLIQLCMLVMPWFLLQRDLGSMLISCVRLRDPPCIDLAQLKGFASRYRIDFTVISPVE